MNYLTLGKREKVVEYQTEALFLIFVQVFHVMMDNNMLTLLVTHLVKIGKSKRVQTDEDCTKRYLSAGHNSTLKHGQEEKINTVLHVI